MKKMISIVLATIMSISAIATVDAVEYGEEYTNKPDKVYKQQFNDVSESHWAFSYIGEMTARAVVSGYPNGNFYPDNDVTRAEFARIMTSASGLPISTPTTPDFSDVAVDAWYAPYVHAAYPYLSGYQMSGGNYYKPDTPALREDIAVALVKLKGYDTLGADESILATMFTDVTSISADARKYVAVALERGLVSGYEDDTFRGQDSISRAEATAMLWRAYQYGNDNKTFNEEPTVVPVITTPEPVATPVPVVTEKPTVVATEAPIVTPKPTQTPELIPTEEPVDGKPYVMDTVSKANISDVWKLITSDNESNIYYYDDKENKIFSVNIDSEKVKELYDLSDLKMTDDEIVTVDDVDEETSYYTDFVIEQLLYDTSNDRLLCMGEFESYKDWKDLSPKNDYTDTLILDLSEDEIQCYPDIEGRMLCGMEDYLLLGDIDGDGWGNYDTAYMQYNLEENEEENNFVAEDYYFISDNYNSSCEYVYNFEDGSLYVVCIGANNVTEGRGIVYKYDFSSQRFEIIQDVTSDGHKKVGYGNGKYYFWDIETGTITECGLNGKLTLSDINTSENVEVVDYKKLSEKAGRIFVSEDGRIAFYDNNAIRVIKER